MTSRTRRATGPATAAVPAAQPAAMPGYHHGALREALLAAAEALLLEQGVDAFTLRACARRAGVSHAAPAHHFGDARGLLTAFATVGFERMAALMQRHRDAAPPDPVLQLQAVGQAYIDFALANRAHFQLMFGSDRLDPGDAQLAAAGQATAEMLGQAMAAVMADRQLPPASLPQRLLLAWSAVHGYATLVTEGQCNGLFGLSPDNPQAAQAAGAAMLALLGPALAA
ncbi:MAG: WHG domain-containing protein [Aquabacterium sp.]|nr:WHG domain-containing protein [Aquabacterium sp.]